MITHGIWHTLEIKSLNPDSDRHEIYKVRMDGDVAFDEHGHKVAEREADGRWNILGSPVWGKLTPIGQ